MRGSAVALVVAAVAFSAPAIAAPIANPVATFSGLDKITARITNFDVYINETVQFGSLQITPRVCYTEPATETQRTAVFVEVDQVNLKGATQRIFTGWMFADSPALNAIDDAVYDFWLVDCAQRSDVPPPTVTNPEPATPAPGAAAAPAADLAPAAAVAPAAAADIVRNTPTDTGRNERGSIVTLINPKPTAETSPD